MLFFREKLSLAKYGDEFKDSYIIVKVLDANQMMKYSRLIYKLMDDSEKAGIAGDEEKAVDKSYELVQTMYKKVKECFVSGEIFDEKLRPMSKKDIDEFPNNLIKELSGIIQGNLEKKS